MIQSWGELAIWFVTSLTGAALVKIIDYISSRYQEKRHRIKVKVDKVLEYVSQFGELTELYRFSAFVSENVVMSDDGVPKRDLSGKPVIESKVLEPEPRFEEAIRELKGANIDTAITQKLATIRLKSSEALDIVSELDPTGHLMEQFKNLYLKTVFSIESVLKNKDSGKPDEKFEQMINALEEADTTRRSFRASLQIYQR